MVEVGKVAGTGTSVIVLSNKKKLKKQKAQNKEENYFKIKYKALTLL